MLIHEALTEYFEQALKDALRDEEIHLSDPVFHYLVQVCCDFAEQRAFGAHESRGEPGTPTLTWMVERAQELPGPARFEAYRSLGDVALVVSGLFAPHVERRRSLVGRGYYVDMGRTAYAAAAALARVTSLRATLDELARQFRRLVEALGRVAEASTLPTVQDPAALLQRMLDDPQAHSPFRGFAQMGLAPVWAGSSAGVVKA